MSRAKPYNPKQQIEIEEKNELDFWGEELELAKKTAKHKELAEELEAEERTKKEQIKLSRIKSGVYYPSDF